MIYHNTTNVGVEQLSLFTKKAGAQDKAIYEFMQLNPNKQYSASDLHQHVLKGAPLTSLRRSLTSLHKMGMINKTTLQKDGPYGRPEYLWQYIKS